MSQMIGCFVKYYLTKLFINIVQFSRYDIISFIDKKPLAFSTAFLQTVSLSVILLIFPNFSLKHQYDILQLTSIRKLLWWKKVSQFSSQSSQSSFFTLPILQKKLIFISSFLLRQMSGQLWLPNLCQDHHKPNPQNAVESNYISNFAANHNDLYLGKFSTKLYKNSVFWRKNPLKLLTFNYFFLGKCIQSRRIPTQIKKFYEQTGKRFK